MSPALQKTFEILLIIGIGLLLQRKLQAKQQLEGLKVIILNVALPATIFLALLRVDLHPAFLALPLLALGYNLYMFLSVRYLLPHAVHIPEPSQKRTLAMLLPSLAPGLSCFPFILTYLGDEHLALAALADVGNKFFGLILLYMLAMHWYHQRKKDKDTKISVASKLKGLFLSLMGEPINLVIALAILMLLAGIGIDSLPGFLGATIERFSVMMVALVLLFIGLAVKVNLADLKSIGKLLLWRSGMALLFSSICLFMFPSLAAPAIMLIIVFPQSACSFWPFAHMHLVSKQEINEQQARPTFDPEYAVNLLACSLPFSSMFILLLFNFSGFFSNPWVLLGVGLSLIGLSLLFRVSVRAFRWLKNGLPENVIP